MSSYYSYGFGLPADPPTESKKTGSASSNGSETATATGTTLEEAFGCKANETYSTLLQKCLPSPKSCKDGEYKTPEGACKLQPIKCKTDEYFDPFDLICRKPVYSTKKKCNTGFVLVNGQCISNKPGSSPGDTAAKKSNVPLIIGGVVLTALAFKFLT